MNPTEWLWLVLGIVGTWIGAELLVRGAAGLALHWGVRPLVVGLTVVALGTSSPEAVVSLLAATKGATGIAMGNVVGSNIANIGLILGLTALMHSLPIEWTRLRIDLSIMVLATAVATLMAMDGAVTRVDGLILLVLLLAYLGYYAFNRQSSPHDGPTEPSSGSVAGFATKTVLGLVILVVGANALLHAAEALARAWGIPESVIGATMVAVGTSLPELAASVVAVARGHHEIGVGNIVGSNVMNLLFVLGSVATVSNIDVDPQIRGTLIPVMVVYTLVLIPIMRTGFKISRLEGAALLGSYVVVAISLF